VRHFAASEERSRCGLCLVQRRRRRRRAHLLCDETIAGNTRPRLLCVSAAAAAALAPLLLLLLPRCTLLLAKAPIYCILMTDCQQGAARDSRQRAAVKHG